MRRRLGFTFMELMLVVVILAALAAFTFPRLGGTYHRARLQQAARELAATLRQARYVAVIRGDASEVRLDPSGGRYQLGLINLDAEGEPIEEEEDPAELDRIGLTAEDLRIRSLPEDVYFILVDSAAPPSESGGRPRVLFYPDGSAAAAALAVQNQRRQALHIEIFRTTGMVKVRPGRPVVPPEARPLFYLPE